MPRAKKQAPSTPVPSLQSCNIAFVRLTAVGIGGLSQADLKDEIAKNGGTFVSKIDSQCTHLIASEEQYQKQSVRIKDAVATGTIKIVTIDWLTESFKSSGRVDEAGYLLDAQVPTGQLASDDEKPSSVKRARGTQDNDGADKKVPVRKKVKKEPSVKEQSKSSVINVPLDEGIPDKDKYNVVIDDDGTIYDATLNQTNAGHNNNKFYRIQILLDTTDKTWCWTRWGRVGEKGQMKMLGNGEREFALRQFKKKFMDKNGNRWENRFAPVGDGKYSFIERSYEDSEDEAEDKPDKSGKHNSVKKEDDEEAEETPIPSKLPEAVQQLMKLIFNQEYFDSTLASLDYDANKMPLGKLSKNTLLRGYTVLKDLTAVLNGAAGDPISNLSNQYFSLIPHAFGRNRPPVLNNMAMIKKEIELLESLTDMQLANDIMKNARGKKGPADQVNLLDRQFEGLNMQEMSPLDPKSAEYTQLEHYLKKSGGHTHHIRYKVQAIFRIERQGEFERFNTSKFAQVSNSDRRLLWHGSRCTNFGGILSQGLRIAPPEAPVSGYMFGKGVYLADMSSKSANYCCSHNSGGIGLLLLCEAELGKPPLKLVDSNYEAEAEATKQGSISTWGVGQSAPQQWKDASCVHDTLQGTSMPDVVSKPPGSTNEDGAWLQYNEYIVYDVKQIKMRYLFRCQIN